MTLRPIALVNINIYCSRDLPWHNVTNLRNALFAVGTCHNAVYLRNAHIVVGTCHGMSADARSLICMVLGDMPWHVPTT